MYPRIPHRLLILSATIVLISFTGYGETTTVKAQPKKGRTVTPPLSENVPAALRSLPVFGTIAWETHQLPWVGEGPDEGISGIGMVEIDGIIYLVGGFIPGGDETDDTVSKRTSRWTWSYNPATKTWTRMADAPVRREYVRAVAAEGKLYLAGGGCQYKGEDPPYRAHGECAVFDPQAGPKGTWTMLDSLPVPRTHMAVGYGGGQVVVLGGNQYAFSEKGYSYNTIRGNNATLDLGTPGSTWQTRTPIPGAPRGWCASMPVGDAIYLFGGITWDEQNNVVPTPETLRYDPSSDTWSTKSPPPLPISGWEGALYADRYAINVGGVVRTSPRHLDELKELIWSDLCIAYDTVEDRWMQVHGALPPGAVFNDPGVVIMDDTIYVIGAEGPHGSHYDYFMVGTIAVEK